MSTVPDGLFMKLYKQGYSDQGIAQQIEGATKFNVRYHRREKLCLPANSIKDIINSQWFRQTKNSVVQNIRYKFHRLLKKNKIDSAQRLYHKMVRGEGREFCHRVLGETAINMLSVLMHERARNRREYEKEMKVHDQAR